MKLSNFIHLLCCPQCHGPLTAAENAAECPVCKKRFRTHDSKIVFEKLSKKEIADPLDRIKFLFKKYPDFYQLIVRIISPLYDDGKVSRFITEHVSGKGVTALNFGSGNTLLSPDLINIDIVPYPRVNIVCPAENVPLSDNCADIIFSDGLLEHVPEPALVIAEMRRILKPGGTLFVVMPFIQGYHASPHDYTRFTKQGLKELMKDFEIEYTEASGGPTSALLWIFQEYCAILFSCGNKHLHSAVYIAAMLLTFPLKYLDYFLLKTALSDHISTRFICFARKPF